MKLLWTKIWISLATVLIALVTLGLIIALHTVKFGMRLFAFLFGKRRHGPRL